jgi:hypothetical protein
MARNSKFLQQPRSVCVVKANELLPLLTALFDFR